MPGSHGSGCGCREEDSGPTGGHWLHSSIDHESVVSAGGSTPGSARLLFRAYEERLDDDRFIESADEDDAELIISVSFTSPTKLTAVSVIGGVNGSIPMKLCLFANAHVGDFSVVHDSEPTQAIELAEDFCGSVEYPLRVAKFSQVLTLMLHFPAVVDGQKLRIHWIGLKGVASGDKRQAVVAVYEAKPNLADHKTKSDPLKNNMHVS